jgi:hypothetical protein
MSPEFVLVKVLKVLSKSTKRILAKLVNLPTTYWNWESNQR